MRAATNTPRNGCNRNACHGLVCGRSKSERRGPLLWSSKGASVQVQHSTIINHLS